ncbi:MAG: peptidylprolyl isomerase [Vallitaleaceae bacterium]|nr:peptidylprolyl isomerase [Vallitaleaceae bacterium]
MLAITKKSNSIANQIKGFLRIVLMILALGSLVSCAKKPEDASYLVEVDGVKVQKNEVMIYVHRIVEEFVRVGGENVWEFEDFSGGKSALEVAKESVLENLVRIKVLNRKAQGMGIVLNEEEQQLVKTQSKEYQISMKENYRLEHKITSELIESVFMEFAIANRVIELSTADFTPKEDDIQVKMQKSVEYQKLLSAEPLELLTDLEVEFIFFSFLNKQEDEIDNLRKLAEKIKERLDEGEDFYSLQRQFSEIEKDPTGTLGYEGNGSFTFSMAFLPEGFESLKGLEKNEISDIMEKDTGYYIFLVKSIQQPTAEEVKDYQDNFKIYEESVRNAAIEELKLEAFNTFYIEWQKAAIVRLNKEEWDVLSIKID